jgi:molecular chaperone GrpE
MAAEQSKRLSGLRAAWRALRGAPPATSDPRSRLAALALELRERDAELALLRDRCRLLGDEIERARAEAAEAEREVLGRRLAGPLAQLATMQALADAGSDLRVTDVLMLVARIESALGEAGLARFGQVGAQVPFDPSLHESLSGADLRPGEPVIVRFIGYRVGARVARKAMVDRPGASGSAGERDDAGRRP